MKNISHYKDNIKRTILIVDDEYINRALLDNIVNQEYNTLFAEDGEEALKLMNDTNYHISLVLLDLMMPKINGFEVLDIVRQDERLKKVPIIVLTSELSAEVTSLQKGAVDFISKPFEAPDVILARIKKAIDLEEYVEVIKNTERDHLTGLFTKHYFFEYINEYEEYKTSINMDAVVLNIKRFHLINEIRGHLYGDLVLSFIGKKLKELFDYYEGIVCRTDGDTFYLFFEHQDDIENTLDKYLIKPVVDKFHNLYLSFRIGIYQNVPVDANIEDVFECALHACNLLRKNYKDSFSYYDAEMHNKEIFNERLINHVDKALEDKEFKVFFQPKYEIHGEKPVLCSAEALVRWVHPEYGMISPGVFIPLFEENGLIQKIDYYVWNEVGRKIREWMDRFNKVIPVSINVSRIDIYDPLLESKLMGIIERNKIDISSLMLEITESAYTSDSKTIIETITNLRYKGFLVEMDDFGTGYSSLNMVSNLPIDILKIDMSFIKNMCNNEKDLKMVEILLNISEFLKVKVIAEGVETKEQYDLLKEMGCDIIQGYYLSRPLPSDQFEAII